MTPPPSVFPPARSDSRTNPNTLFDYIHYPDSDIVEWRDNVGNKGPGRAAGATNSARTPRPPTMAPWMLNKATHDVQGTAAECSSGLPGEDMEHNTESPNTPNPANAGAEPQHDTSTSGTPEDTYSPITTERLLEEFVNDYSGQYNSPVIDASDVPMEGVESSAETRTSENTTQTVQPAGNTSQRFEQHSTHVQSKTASQSTANHPPAPPVNQRPEVVQPARGTAVAPSQLPQEATLRVHVQPAQPRFPAQSQPAHHVAQGVRPAVHTFPRQVQQQGQSQDPAQATPYHPPPQAQAFNQSQIPRNVAVAGAQLPNAAAYQQGVQPSQQHPVAQPYPGMQIVNHYVYAVAGPFVPPVGAAVVPQYVPQYSVPIPLQQLWSYIPPNFLTGGSTNGAVSNPPYFSSSGVYPTASVGWPGGSSNMPPVQLHKTAITTTTPAPLQGSSQGRVPIPHPSVPQSSIPQPRFPQSSSPKPTYPQNPYPQPRLPQSSTPKPSYPQPSYRQPAPPKPTHPQRPLPQSAPANPSLSRSSIPQSQPANPSNSQSSPVNPSGPQPSLVNPSLSRSSIPQSQPANPSNPQSSPANPSHTQPSPANPSRPQPSPANPSNLQSSHPQPSLPQPPLPQYPFPQKSYPVARPSAPSTQPLSSLPPSALIPPRPVLSDKRKELAGPQRTERPSRRYSPFPGETDVDGEEDSTPKRHPAPYRLENGKYVCTYTGPAGTPQTAPCGRISSARDRRTRNRHLATHAIKEEELIAKNEITQEQAVALEWATKIVFKCDKVGCDFTMSVWRTDNVRRNHCIVYHPEDTSKLRARQPGLHVTASCLATGPQDSDAPDGDEGAFNDSSSQDGEALAGAEDVEIEETTRPSEDMRLD